VRPAQLSFSPQYPLWTDGANKRRWIHIPAGASIDASDPDAWSFPAGTRIWKEFAFAGRRVETRFMELGGDGAWRYATYLWLPDGSDALLAPLEGVPAGVPVGAARHAIPSQADCRACHQASRSPVLGFAALQLSSDRDPGALHAAADPDDVDLAQLIERGIVRGLPAALVERPPRIEAATPAARAALGYLHGNCGGCHNAAGPLAPLSLVLAQSVADAGASAVLASAVGRQSRFRAPGRPDAELRVAPGDAEASVVALRMRSRDPLLQMPPIGTLAVDEAAVALIERWISHDLAAQRRAANQQTKETRP
jgi:hypothetical protein